MSPRPSRPWFRFYVEAVNDPKMQELTPAQRWLWVAVLAYARQSPIAGFLVISERLPTSMAALAQWSGMKVREVEKAWPLFETLGMVEMDTNLGAWCIPSWANRQFESDDVAARTAKHRAKERSNAVTENAPETEQNRTEPEREPPKSRRKPEVSVPDDWTPSPELRDWAKREYPQHATKAVLAGFIDNAKKKDLRFRDIDAAFRNWIRQEEKYHPTTPKNQPVRTHL